MTLLKNFLALGKGKERYVVVRRFSYTGYAISKGSKASIDEKSHVWIGGDSNELFPFFCN